MPSRADEPHSITPTLPATLMLFKALWNSMHHTRDRETAQELSGSSLRISHNSEMKLRCKWKHFNIQGWNEIMLMQHVMQPNREDNRLNLASSLNVLFVSWIDSYFLFPFTGGPAGALKYSESISIICCLNFIF